MNRKKKTWMVAVGIVLFFVAGGVWYYAGYGKTAQNRKEELTGILETSGTQISPVTPSVSQPPEQTTAVKKPSLVVFICGAVQCPGVYELDAGSRLYAAVELAGGFTEEADGSYHNLARNLTDGERIYVPTLSETEDYSLQQRLEGEVSPEGAAKGAETTVINLNTATLEQLTTLPGIGQSKAESIMEYRSKVGGFVAIEEIMNISGIGEAMFDKIKDKITVN